MDYILKLDNEQINLLKPGSIYIDENLNICEILKYTDRHKQDLHSDSQITQEGISKPGYRILMKNCSNIDSANSESHTETKEVAPLCGQSVTVPHKQLAMYMH